MPDWWLSGVSTAALLMVTMYCCDVLLHVAKLTGMHCSHPARDNHGEHLDEAFGGHQPVEAEHLAGAHVQTSLGHDAYGGRKSKHDYGYSLPK